MKYRYIIGIILLIILFCLPLRDIECSKIRGTCSIYSRSWLLRNSKLIKMFKISDIERYEIRKNCNKTRNSGCNASYGIYIYTKSGEIIHIDHETSSYERAQEIYNNMINNDFTLKGNYWNSILNNY